MKTKDLENKITLSYKGVGHYVAKVKVYHKVVELKVHDMAIINAIKNGTLRFGVTKREALLILYKRAKDEREF